MNEYLITLSEDYCFLKNHIVVTNLIEKGTNNFNVKSYKKSNREMILVTNKEINEGLYEKKYKNKIFKWKVKKNENLFKKHKTGDNILIRGQLSLSFTQWGTNKDICPIDIKTGAILNKEKLFSFIEKSMGIKNIKIMSIKTFSKTPLDDNKVIIYNRVSLEISGEVLDESVVNKLSIQSIGKMKSYGLGAMEVINEDSL